MVSAPICAVCHEQFDSTRRIPKVGICGHSLCAVCIPFLPSLGKCPICSAPNSFYRSMKNYQMIDLLVEMEILQAARQHRAARRRQAAHQRQAAGQPQASHHPQAAGQLQAAHQPQIAHQPPAPREPQAAGQPQAARSYQDAGRPQAPRQPQAAHQPQAAQRPTILLILLVGILVLAFIKVKNGGNVQFGYAKCMDPQAEASSLLEISRDLYRTQLLAKFCMDKLRRNATIDLASTALCHAHKHFVTGEQSHLFEACVTETNNLLLEYGITQRVVDFFN